MTQKPYIIAHTESSLGWGGQEIRIFTEMVAMRQRGHHLTLFAPSRSAIYARCQEAGFPVHSFSDHKAHYPLTILSLTAAFRREKVQVVNPHSSRDGWLAGVAARIAGVPLVIRSRHIEVDYPNRWLSRIAYKLLAHQVLTTSHRIADRLIRELGLAPGKVACVPTGIDLTQFNPQVPGSLHEELALPPEIPLVGMVSVLRSWKGHKHFLDAAAEIVRQTQHVQFVIAGDGPLRSWLATTIRESGLEARVRMLGHRDDVPNILASLSVLVLPSTAHEGIPQIILQAQAMARAVVGTTVGGIPEVVTDGVTGLLVPPGDARSLVKAISDLLNNADWRSNLGQQARKRAEQEYGLENMCRQLEDLYGAHLRHRHFL